ncbi:MAG: methionine aminotransferase [Vicingaceae bacterium]
MPSFSASLHSKLPKVGQTIFSTMSALAAKENALNLSQGFPDFDGSPELIELVHKAMNSGLNQYAPMPGLLSLRESIAEKTEKLYTGVYHPETEVTVTAGATQAIFTAIAATVNEGDEVILFTPAYDCYEPAIELVGGKPVYVKLEEPDYRINWEAVKKLINQQTKMIIINSPHNPSGSIMSMHDMQQLQKLTEGSNILILSDEVYEHIIFDGYEHQSIARYPKLAERSFVISSFGKTYHTTGWKMGYCLAPADLMKEFRKAHQYNVFAVNTPVQAAYAEFLKKEEEYLNLGAFYQEKRDLFVSLLKGSRFSLKHTAGSYFQLLGYEKISEEKDTDFAIRLTKEHKVASIPISVFYNQNYDNHVLRFCFAKQNSTLEQAAEILQKV